MVRVVFLGNARCYHTMDWYRSVKRQMPPKSGLFVTDLIESEGHRVLVRSDDEIVSLFNIDWALFPTQSKLGGVWRNLVKFAFIPAQALLLRRVVRKCPGAVIHAHTMYYILVCLAARVRCIGTPQGSEILVRPGRSSIYKYFAVKALRYARVITVDSVAMRDKIRHLSGVVADVVQNGVEVGELSKVVAAPHERGGIISVRGMTPLYRIREIMTARERSLLDAPLGFIYPFWDEAYRESVRELMRASDRDLGRLDKTAMYELLGRTMIVVSIPESDSSPRSVYEAIFAGAIVISSFGAWLEALPECMRERVVLVDLADEGWLAKGVELAERKSRQPYFPSEDACAMFDQDRIMARVIENYYMGGARARVSVSKRSVKA